MSAQPGGNMERVLRLMAEKQASDVYLSANSPILIKISGQLLQLSDQPLTHAQPRQLDVAGDHRRFPDRRQPRQAQVGRDDAFVHGPAAAQRRVFLVDDDGGVVEATRANVWVRSGEELLTPPLSKCGLPGVMRDHILETVPGARIASVRAEDLSAAEEVLLSNAVRGLFPVRIGTPLAGRA